jgi:hypothetical protein
MRQWLCLCQTTGMPPCIEETSRTSTSVGVNAKFGALPSLSEVRHATRPNYDTRVQVELPAAILQRLHLEDLLIVTRGTPGAAGLQAGNGVALA